MSCTTHIHGVEAHVTPPTCVRTTVQPKLQRVAVGGDRAAYRDACLCVLAINTASGEATGEEVSMH
eukprot:50608-Eustigmatos_ZCMA.PRE.1